MLILDNFLTCVLVHMCTQFVKCIKLSLMIYLLKCMLYLLKKSSRLPSHICFLRLVSAERNGTDMGSDMLVPVYSLTGELKQG